MALKVFFIGASKFGAKCLETCLSLNDVEVVGLLTAKENFNISYSANGVRNYNHFDFKHYSYKINGPVLTLKDKMNDSDLLEIVREINPDCFLVSGWYHMIPRSWRLIAPAYGLHASLLPKYSGGAPLVWAMINGEKKTGISLFQMDDGVDSGAIYGKEEVEIRDDDTIATLYKRVEMLGVELLRRVLPTLADGSASYYIQDESERSTFPQRSPRDGLIEWDKSAEEIDRFIRAQTQPYPGAFFYFGEKKVTVWKASIGKLSLKPGAIGYCCGFSYVGCADGSLKLEIIEVDGEKHTSLVVF
ncbi:methionyl-tRNA formyltransferase [Marinobacterium sp. xm-d-530]|uniref:methionyl-tRNA formyltransferase n=1 Tax=Marinobacterium sp. xm-d-530 TaxID=2497747 RepID=UPI001567DD84|nr:methionyl-tRNA formyltransferase [Marinobacterium sp. xm-d-530]NRQ01185.1 Bifunctional polymyxin resistance protein ArnA [Marinobacterium sp. xm-d-530]